MNTGQTMLTIEALAMLSLITMNYYGSIGASGRNLSQSQAGLTATTIATSLIERAQNTAFDVVTDTCDDALTNPGLLTHPNYLGRELVDEDSIDNFDDFDDFNGWVEDVSPGYMNELYRARFEVYYVNPTNIEQIVYTRTFVKRMNIKVWRVFPPIDTETATSFDTARVSTILGYFKYNN